MRRSPLTDKVRILWFWLLCDVVSQAVVLRNLTPCFFHFCGCKMTGNLVFANLYVLCGHTHMVLA